MSIFLSVAICGVVFSWFRAKRLGVPWFSWGEPTTTVQMKPVPRLSSGRPAYQSRAKRTKAQKKSQPKKLVQPMPELSSDRPDYQSRANRKKAKKAQRKKSAAEKSAQRQKMAPSFKRLDELTHNAETSWRLVEHVQRLHPDRDLKWCEEKAIYDMKRDRMA